jgi:hypothetical protein
VAPSETLNKSINNAQKHYSSLFSLPTLKKAVLLLFVICLANGFSTVSFSLSFEEVIQGFSMGILFFFLTIACDLFISKILLDDPIFTSRRTIVLSLFNWFVWFFFIIIGLVFSVFIDYSWVFRLS